MSRKVLMGLAIGWLILIGAPVAILMGSVIMLGGTSVSSTATKPPGSPYRVEDYRWDGQPILITAARGTSKNDKRGVITCDVIPDNGERREIQTSRQDLRYYTETTSWFSGPATVQCRKPVTVRAGMNKKLYEMIQNRILLVVAAVVAGGPLAAAIVFGRDKKPASV